MKNKILLVALLLAGAVVGSLVSKATNGISLLNWLSYSKEIGFSNTTINLIVAKLTIGFQLYLSVSELIFMAIAAAFYPKLSKIIF